MQGRTPRPATARSVLRRASGAITWIDARRAIIARTAPAGAIDVETVAAETEGDGRTYLARVAHEIGDRERVVIMGPSELRTMLEREYVTISHRPDRLIDVEPSGPVTEEELVRRLRRLVS